MKYECMPCLYFTIDAGNWFHHKKSKKHVKLCEITNNDTSNITMSTTSNTIIIEKKQNINL